jgi:hypothetical protein
MKQIQRLILTFPLMLCVACCATIPQQPEPDVETVMLAGSRTDEAIIAENIIDPFEPVEFVRKLTGGNMEVVNVYPDPDIEYRIGLPGKVVLGRQYFYYKSPLYPKPISSADEMFTMFNHQTMIAQQLNPGYMLSLDIDIRNAKSEELERKTLTMNVQRGIRIHDYRREGKIKYILRDADGSFRYGEYVIVSAVIIQNEAEAEAYAALQEWMENAEIADISHLLAKLFKKNGKNEGK